MDFWTYDWNGTCFQRRSSTLVFKEFKNARPITALEIFPLNRTRKKSDRTAAPKTRSSVPSLPYSSSRQNVMQVLGSYNPAKRRILRLWHTRVTALETGLFVPPYAH